ncbi:MAG: hypothetical protein AAF436_12120 [Myxococcota bacterium]
MRGLCESYEDWKHCITVECNIPLTPDYVTKRIAVLSDERDPTTARFVALYGDPYRLRTIQWFEQARAELGGARHS